MTDKMVKELSCTIQSALRLEFALAAPCNSSIADLSMRDVNVFCKVCPLVLL